MLAIGLSPMQSISPSSNRVTPLFDYATALRLCVDLIGAEFAHDDDALFHVQLHSVGADLARYAKPESVSQSGRRIHVGVWKDWNNIVAKNGPVREHSHPPSPPCRQLRDSFFIFTQACHERILAIRIRSVPE
jgi:hypothetical protein